jgi:hypothetical protein
MKNMLDFTLFFLKAKKSSTQIWTADLNFVQVQIFFNLYIFNALYLLVGNKLNLNPDSNMQII